MPNPTDTFCWQMASNGLQLMLTVYRWMITPLHSFTFLTQLICAKNEESPFCLKGLPVILQNVNLLYINTVVCSRYHKFLFCLPVVFYLAVLKCKWHENSLFYSHSDTDDSEKKAFTPLREGYLSMRYFGWISEKIREWG